MNFITRNEDTPLPAFLFAPGDRQMGVGGEVGFIAGWESHHYIDFKDMQHILHYLRSGSNKTERPWTRDSRSPEHAIFKINAMRLSVF